MTLSLQNKNNSKQQPKYKTLRQKANFEKIDNLVQQGCEYFSFDIFDTIITRTTYSPYGIFALIQNELITNNKYSSLPDVIRYNFYNIRTGTPEFLNYTRYADSYKISISADEIKEEFNLDDIYNVIKKSYSLSDEQINSLINLELEFEYKNSTAIKENIDLIKYLLEKNKKILLISDMYLSQENIKNILLKHDDIFKDIPIYVSSKYGRKKSNAKLFSIVRKKEKLDYSKWCHIGDNEKSDIQIPKALKMQTIHFKQKNLTEFEQSFYNLEFNQNASEELALGLSKNTRMFLEDNNKAEFAAFAVIVLYPYVKWILDSSIEQNINRLYFIARDGYILKTIADIIIKEDNLPLNTHYIYGSRRAWGIPLISQKEDLVRPVKKYSKGKNIAVLADDLEISFSELIRFLPERLKNKNKKLDATLLKNVYNYLIKDDEFLNFIKEKNKNKNELTKKYLFQELDLSDDKFALVDLTASGYSCCQVAREIFRQTNLKTKNFNICSYANINKEYYTPLVFLKKKTDSIIECFCRAPHGQTIGYKEEGNKVIPILENNEIIEDFKDYENAIKFSSLLYHNAVKINEFKDIGNIAQQYIYTLSNCPSKKISSFLNSICLSGIGVKGDKRNIIKTSLSLTDIINTEFKNIIYTSEGQFSSRINNSNLLVKLAAKFFKTFPNFKEPTIKKTFYCIKKYIEQIIL